MKPGAWEEHDGEKAPGTPTMTSKVLAQVSGNPVYQLNAADNLLLPLSELKLTLGVCGSSSLRLVVGREEPGAIGLIWPITFSARAAIVKSFLVLEVEKVL